VDGDAAAFRDNPHAVEGLLGARMNAGRCIARHERRIVYDGSVLWIATGRIVAGPLDEAEVKLRVRIAGRRIPACGQVRANAPASARVRVHARDELAQAGPKRVRGRALMGVHVIEVEAAYVIVSVGAFRHRHRLVHPPMIEHGSR
jgi:hypothetical protein